MHHRIQGPASRRPYIRYVPKPSAPPSGCLWFTFWASATSASNVPNTCIIVSGAIEAADARGVTVPASPMGHGLNRYATFGAGERASLDFFSNSRADFDMSATSDETRILQNQHPKRPIPAPNGHNSSAGR